MIKLSRKIEYALISLNHLKKATEGQLTSAKDLSVMYAIPFDVVSRVLQILNQKNIVKSVQGVHGGYFLSANLKDVSFKDLIEAIEGPLSLVKCISNSDECDMKSLCTISSPLLILNQKVKDFYSTLTLEEILSSVVASENVDIHRGVIGIDGVEL